jgi:tRNA(adenine34) deaminase
MNEDKKYLNIAISLAKKAKSKGDFPVGAIIVKKNKIISKAYNSKEHKRNAINHAEIIAINKACKKLKTWHLDDCTLYTSLEPCMMCTGAIMQSRIKRIVYANSNLNFGAIENKNTNLSKKIEVIKIENNENLMLLTNFFTFKR